MKNPNEISQFFRNPRWIPINQASSKKGAWFMSPTKKLDHGNHGELAMVYIPKIPKPWLIKPPLIVPSMVILHLLVLNHGIHQS
jgi:hypothetical protein